jgi:hypothetical protein
MSKPGHPRDILTKEQRQDIITAYLANEKYYDLAGRFGVTDSCIWAVLNRANVRRTRLVVTEEDLLHARQFCSEQRSRKSVLPLLPPAITKSQKRKVVDHHAFDEITPNSAYWIGMLITDGSVVWYDNLASVVLQLGVADRDHVVKFQDFMKTDHAITDIKPGTVRPIYDGGKPLLNRGASRISIGSNRLADVLSMYGVVPNKSLVASVNHLEINPDFWRGAVDGDGSIRQDRSPSVRMHGSKRIIWQFSEFCRAVYPPAKVNVAQRGNIFVSSVNGKTAAILCDCMYNNDGTALDRKKKIALNILSTFNIKRVD